MSPDFMSLGDKAGQRCFVLNYERIDAKKHAVNTLYTPHTVYNKASGYV